jgi:hypothetical protein
VAVRRGLRVDRAQEVEVVDDRLGRRSKTSRIALVIVSSSTWPVPNVSTYSPTGSARPIA